MRPDVPWEVALDADRAVIRDCSLEELDVDVDLLTGRRARRQFIVGGLLIIVLLMLSPLLFRFCN